MINIVSIHTNFFINILTAILAMDSLYITETFPVFSVFPAAPEDNLSSVLNIKHL